MQTLDSLNPQYLTDADGRRTAVVLSLDAFDALVGVATERSADPTDLDLLRSASQSPVFADLLDPSEDLYSVEDGRPFRL